MKKISLVSIVLLIAAQALAIVAKPGKRTVVQPNGDTLMVYAYGDHRFHWLETADGQWVAQDSVGWYRPIPSLSPEQIQAQREASHYAIAEKQAAAKKAAVANAVEPQRVASPLNIAPRGLVLLVNFADKSFTSDIEDIKNMISSDNYQRDYSYRYSGQTITVHAEGSAKTYFEDQSMGTYSPEFDIMGPYTVSNNMSYYGSNNDYYAYKMVIEACKLANADGADFTKYDCDNDGQIDFVFVIYAGYGEADGGPKNTIWPHTYDVSYYENVKLDGKKLATYACGQELQYISKEHDGIGTFVHEFSHVLGLPDIYATNYATHKTLSDWDVMDAGPYNNDGNTPPAYSAYERFFLGWLTPTLLNKPASPILEDIIRSNKAYIITKTGQSNFQGNDPKPKEFYILENRQQYSWDAYLAGHGLMITKIKYDYDTWEDNTVNNTSTQMGIDLIESDGKSSSYYSRAKDLFPAGNDHYTPYEDYPITEIMEEDGRITFDFMGGYEWLTPYATEEANSSDKKGRTYTHIQAIYDVSGNLIATEVDLRHLAPGFYIIQVADDGEGREQHTKGVSIIIR